MSLVLPKKRPKRKKITENERRILQIQQARRLYTENPTLDYVAKHRFYPAKNLVSLVFYNFNTTRELEGDVRVQKFRQEEFGSEMWIAWAKKQSLRFVSNNAGKSNLGSANKLVSIGKKINTAAVFSIIVPNREPHLDFLRLVLHTNFGAYTLVVANNLNVNKFLFSVKANNNVLFLHYIHAVLAKTPMFFIDF